jgi:hypothetical protein
LSRFCLQHVVMINQLNIIHRQSNYMIFDLITLVEIELHNDPCQIDFEMLEIMIRDITNYFKRPYQFLMDHILPYHRLNELFDYMKVKKERRKYRKQIGQIILYHCQIFMFVSVYTFQYLLHFPLPCIGNELTLYSRWEDKRYFFEYVKMLRYDNLHIRQIQTFSLMKFSRLPEIKRKMSRRRSKYPLENFHILSEYVPVFPNHCSFSRPRYVYIYDLQREVENNNIRFVVDSLNCIMEDF